MTARSPTLRALLAAVVLAVLVGCSGGGGSADPVLDGTDVLAEVGPSVALVETALGSGSAVLLTDGHLVTNAHVIDPFREATVSLDGAEPAAVPVVGVDLAADIAVLGPIETDAAGVDLVGAGEVEPGADLYLVGYPGDVDDPEVTIARGVLSRRRQVPDWDVSFLQTDAAIGEGQSGGAVVDETGAVVGISGFSLDEEFALALEGDDAAASVADILDDGASEWPLLPADDAATAGTTAVELSGGVGVGALYVPASGNEGTLDLTLADGEDAAVEVTTLDGATEALNEAAASRAPAPGETGDPGAGDGADEPDGDVPPDPTAAVGPGAWIFEVPAGEPLLVYVDHPDPTRPSISVETTVPVVLLDPFEEPQTLAVGESDEGTATFLGEATSYLLDLETDEEVTISVTSAVGDMAYSVSVPGDPEGGEAQEVDDGGGGLFDLDASEVITATEGGTFRVAVYQVDGYSTDYRIEVTPAS